MSGDYRNPQAGDWVHLRGKAGMYKVTAVADGKWITCPELGHWISTSLVSAWKRSRFRASSKMGVK